MRHKQTRGRRNPCGWVSQRLFYTFTSHPGLLAFILLSSRADGTKSAVTSRDRETVWERREHWSISEWLESPGECMNSTRVNEKTTVWVVRAEPEDRRGADRDVRCALRFRGVGSRSGKEVLAREHAVARRKKATHASHTLTDGGGHKAQPGKVKTTSQEVAAWKQLRETHTHTRTHGCTLMAPLKDTQMAGATQIQATGAYLIIIS